MVDAEAHSTHEMVKGLHARFDNFELRIDKVETRVGSLEKGLAADVAHLEKHESEAALKGEAVLDKLAELTSRLDKRADREAVERLWLLGLVFVTMIGAIGSLGMLVLTGGAA